VLFTHQNEIILNIFRSPFSPDPTLHEIICVCPKLHLVSTQNAIFFVFWRTGGAAHVFPATGLSAKAAAASPKPA
jgi:hypothetical protein